MAAGFDCISPSMIGVITVYHYVLLDITSYYSILLDIT